MKNKKNEYLHFLYDIEKKTMDLSDELCDAYKEMPKHFENMPSDFAKLYIHKDDINLFEAMYAKIDTGAAFATSDFRLKSPEHWVRVCLFHPDCSQNIVSGFVQQVSEQYSVLLEEKEKQKAMLSEALELAERASNAKSDFLSHMSHDIRTPMNAILGFTNFALKENDLSIIKDEYLPKIQISSKHLLMLINDVLEMSRIESGKIELNETPCHLGILSREILSVINPQAKDKNINLFSKAVIKDNYVYCDKLRMNQIITNLLSNALKFTHREGTVHVEFIQHECEEAGYANFELVVKDNGIGMSKEFAKNVFEPFEQERTSTVSGMEGTGLGLAIVKKIVDLMDGTISVQSKEGQGTTFKVNFSLRLVEPRVIATLSNGDNPENEIDVDSMKAYFSGKRLLLVEDNDFNRSIAELILLEAGFIVELAEDGIYAVERVKNAPTADYYDAILMDIQMPIMDGYEATRNIRALDEDYKDVKIIAVTANAFESDVKNALAAGMNAHISKPINVDELYKVLMKEIER